MIFRCRCHHFSDFVISVMRGVFLGLVFMHTGWRFFIMESEAAIQVKGRVHPYPVDRTPISVRCWFSAGDPSSLKSIEHQRRLFTDPQNQVTLMSETNKDFVGGNYPVNRIFDRNTYVTGNLTHGVRYGIRYATCSKDAGVYRCVFTFSTPIANSVHVMDKARVDVLPEKLACSFQPTIVDFSKIHSKPVYLNVKCEAITTVPWVNWIWEFKEATESSEWKRVSNHSLSSIIPQSHARCTQPWVGALFYQISPKDKNRTFRVYLTHEGGQSKMTVFFVKDKGDIEDDYGDFNGLDAFEGFQNALTTTGWILLGMMILILVGLLVSQGVYPGVARSLGLNLQGRGGRSRTTALEIRDTSTGGPAPPQPGATHTHQQNGNEQQQRQQFLERVRTIETTSGSARSMDQPASSVDASRGQESSTDVPADSPGAVSTVYSSVRLSQLLVIEEGDEDLHNWNTGDDDVGVLHAAASEPLGAVARTTSDKDSRRSQTGVQNPSGILLRSPKRSSGAVVFADQGGSSSPVPQTSSVRPEGSASVQSGVAEESTSATPPANRRYFLRSTTK